MSASFDLELWRNTLMGAVSDGLIVVGQYAPKVVGGILLVVFGWIVAHFVARLSNRLLRSLGVDRAATRFGIADVLPRAGIRTTPSEATARCIYWLIIGFFVMVGVRAVGLPFVSEGIDRILATIPMLVGAVVIVVLGLLLARLLGAFAASGAAASGIARADRLGFVVSILVGALALMMAVDQLGLSIELLVAPLSIALGVLALVVGLTFAQGARPIVTHILAGHFLKQSLPRDVFVEVEGKRGVVERIGAVDTVFRNDDLRWSVPNAKLLELEINR